MSREQVFGSAEQPIAGSAANVRSAKDRICRKIIENGLLALIVFSPLPAGSVHEWSILIIELAAVALTAVYFLMDVPPCLNVRLIPRLRWPRTAFAGLFAFIALQMVPLPVWVVQVLSPHTVTLQRQFSPGFAAAKTTTLSLIAPQSLRSGLELLAYVLIGFLVLKTVTHRSQIKRFMTALVLMGVFEAFYGLFELYRANPMVLFYRKTHSLNAATGTFFNQNHFSGYLELVVPIGLSLLISRISLFTMPGRKWRDRLAQLTSQGVTLNVLLAIGLVVMSLAILLSRSRSGVFLLLLTFILFFEMTAFHFGKTRYRQAWVAKFLVILFLIITVIALYVGFEATIGRFSVDNLLQEGRPQSWGHVLRMIQGFPLFGTGLGAFGRAYQVYDFLGAEWLLVHAHNDYLEYAAELGLIGFGLLAFAIFYMVQDIIRTWSSRRRPEIKGLSLGGLVAVVVMLIHSLTDFNLHIPANALLFSVVLGLAYSAVYYRKT